MSLNLSNNSIANHSDELATTLKRGKPLLSIDVLVVCLFCVGAIVPTLGIVGNSAVLIIIKRNRAFQTAQNYLLGNLAVADITDLLFCAFTVIPWVTVLPDGVIRGHVAALVRSHAIGLLPFRLTKEQTTQTMDPSPKTIELLHYPGQWNLELTGSCYSTGYSYCQFFVGFNVPLTSTAASVFTLAVLAVERYHAMVKPMQMSQLTRETVPRAIAATWLASIVLNAPIFVYTDYKFKKAFCRQTYSKEAELTHVAFYAIFVFLIPFAVVTFCYGKIVRTLSGAVCPKSNISEKEKVHQKRQLLKISLTVNGVFAGFVGTACITVVLRYFRLVSQTFRACGLLLLFLSSAVNPFIYAFHSSNYRRAFKTLLKCKKL